jgi:deazaflavin-dependent oxidoreductase (nitroreductase family)
MMAKRGKPWWYRTGEKLAASRPGGWFFVTIAPKIDRFLIPATNGRLSTVPTHPIGVVTMMGAKSGQPRPTPLVCTPDGDDWILVASNGGSKKNPSWYYNLKANPEVTLQISGNTGSYIAREVSGDERETYWEKAADLYAGYDAYSKRSGRDIPVFVLSPKEDSADNFQNLSPIQDDPNNLIEDTDTPS